MRSTHQPERPRRRSGFGLAYRRRTGLGGGHAGGRRCIPARRSRVARDSAPRVRRLRIISPPVGPAALVCFAVAAVLIDRWNTRKPAQTGKSPAFGLLPGVRA